MGRRLRSAIALCLCLLVQMGQAQPWLPAPLAPDNNPSSPAKIALGQALFHDERLSDTGTYSCASCHDPKQHFTDGLALAIGVTGAAHTRNTPTLYNVAYHSSYGWDDSGITSLEAQHIVPLTNTDPVEMGFSAKSLAMIQEHYRAQFESVFAGTAVSLEVIAQAIAAYVRTIRAPESAWDRYVYFDAQDALDGDAKEGMALFFSERLGCAHCHSSFNFSGPLKYKKAGSVEIAEPVFHHTGVTGSTASFRAPTLRAIKHTAPYMHAGQFETLGEVISHYETTNAERVPEFKLSDSERNQLISFLNSL